VEKFIPPRKGRSHVLRVIREVLFFEPKRRGTDLKVALDFLMRVQSHKAVTVVVSDFITSQSAADLQSAESVGKTADYKSAARWAGPLPRALQTSLRMANRKHDVVAVQITDRYELQLPALGRLILEDAETGEVVEVNTGNASSRAAFALRQEKHIGELAKQFRSSGIDSIQLRTDQPYGAALGKFFETREKRRSRG
jgi:uncharacterized protein (DUF58 family)